MEEENILCPACSKENMVVDTERDHIYCPKCGTSFTISLLKKLYENLKNIITK